jgi:MFS family permease
MVFMGSLVFLPLYIQLGQGVAATTSGLSMLAMMAGMLSSSAISGQLVSRTGHYKPVMIAGAAIMIAGLFFMSRVGFDTTTADLCWRLLLIGIGMGPPMSTFNLAVQNALPSQQIGVATSSTQFFRQIGSTVGVALFGAVLAHNLTVELAHHRPASTAQVQTLDLSDLQRFARLRSNEDVLQGQGEGVSVDKHSRRIVSQALADVFKVGLALTVLAFALVLMVPGLKLHGRHG